MEGAPNTAKRLYVVLWVAPLATYIKEGGGGGRPRRVAPIGGVQLGFPILVGVPFLFQEGREGRSRRGRRKEGGAAHSLVQFGPAHWGGGMRPPLEALLSFPVWPIKAHYFPRRIPVTLRYSEKYPNHSEPFRCPIRAFQYIKLYLSIISRLLVMSVITSGLRTTFGTSKHINS